jgi:N-hydroxyarylamine O-acetyltransferase
MAVSWHSNLFTYTPDLDAYFKRINYTGPRDVTAEVLKQIQWHHLLAIPFEVLDCHVSGGKIDLTPEVVERKMVLEGRGGYCYEHNTLLLYILKAMGFDVTPILARSRWMKPVDVSAGLTHLVLKVNVEGKLWLFDVGWSNLGSAIPLLIETEEEQPTPLETRRILKTEEFYIHQMYSLGKWHDMFVFTLDRSYPVDWEIGSYFVSTHPTSFAVLAVVVSMPTETCRHLLNNKVLTTRYPDGSSESREIATEQEYIEVLKTVFKLTLPAGFTVCPPNTTW